MPGIDEDTLAVLACEIEARPAGSPSIADLLPMVGEVRREDRAVVVSFAADTLSTVQAFAVAERICCAEIGWDVEPGPPVTLRITASSEQLDLVDGIFRR
jgi:hypothetical protein